MSEFKEFQGKTLDEAIQSACEHYDVPRAKLEIEIISGGSTGIFGLVGVRKASVKARPRGGVKPVLSQEASKDTKQSAPRSAGEANDAQRQKKSAKSGSAQAQEPKNNAPAQEDSKPKSTPRSGSKPHKAPAPKPEAKAEAAEPVRQAGNGKAGQDAGQTPEYPPRRTVHEANPAPVPADKDTVPDFPGDEPEQQPADNNGNGNGDNNSNGNGSRGPSLEGLDKEKLQAVVREAALTLLHNLAPDPGLDITVEADRVHVMIDDEEHSGLIIGREGQTLSALQYLLNRIVSRNMGTSVRVQLDTGDYRERQDEKLRQQARRMAEKAIKSRRTQSTKPMSSYHRRVVHLTVQEMSGVITRSKGEGPLKRVLIVPKRRSR